MINLKKYGLPQAIEVRGSFFYIHTDFKYILTFFDVLHEKPADVAAFDFMYINEKPADKLAGLQELIKFANPKRDLPRRSESSTDDKVIDWTLDAELIYSAFYEVYGIDLIDTHLHWHKFLALFNGLHDTELNRIIDIRLFMPDGDNSAYNKRMQKLQDAWRLPQDNNEKDEALEAFEAQLK